ncbi:serpin family protein [Actinoplanes sp. KI2]|uniref:serpin family protein n=1 Tax=Actinoplanes sp. KI2 TaxID=2983315 RepID=UPI0021D5AD28|nr:serpin family protein [Actinoplanes sp. KI2]MCU7730519.1 serpin family protein [Actinoplanes sp. KI2]
MNRKLIALLAVALLVGACGSTVPGDAGRIDAKLVSDLQPGDAQAVARSVDAFGFDLFRQLADGKQNTITSPLSVAVLLAMVLAGADGDTATRMAEVLHLGERRDVRVGALLRELADTDEVKLSVADALWASPRTPLQKDFQDFVRRTFGATVEQDDLASPQIVRTIDDWASKNTGGRIDHIASDLGLPDPQSAVVLLNAVYFLGRWQTPFDAGNTRPAPFAVGGGAPVDVPTMWLGHTTLGYAQLDGYRMLRLPYGKHGRYGMEIMLPDRGRSLSGLLAGLDEAKWRSAVGRLGETEIEQVTLPKFELRWSGGLLKPLQRLGLPTTGFSSMSAADPALTTVVHKTYVKVDEQGTEAAAVTGGNMAMSARANPLEFRVDRPFAFTISDTETGAILFLGAVTDPRS